MTEEDNSVKNFKVMVIGKDVVGKSTLLLRYIEGEFNPQQPTIGIDYNSKKVNFEEHNFNLELWDSSGQAKYRIIIENYCNLSKAACVVFDLTSEDSLRDAQNWLEKFVERCGKDIPKILLGNKSDLLSPEDFKQKLETIKPEINKLKEEYECEFFAVSAKTGEGIDTAFEYLIKKLVEKNKHLFCYEKENISIE